MCLSLPPPDSEHHLQIRLTTNDVGLIQTKLDNEGFDDGEIFEAMENAGIANCERISSVIRLYDTGQPL